MNSDRITRRIALYFFSTLFIVLLPVVLSYSLGYKIDYGVFKVYKTGIMYINSYPAGASVYVNGKLQPGLTPMQVEELKPGTYRVEVMREDFYPWQMDLTVMPKMVTKADRIILFPIIKDMAKINLYPVTDFIVSDNSIYYLSKYGLFRSNMDGSNSKKLSSYTAWPDNISGKKFSPDGEKILYYTRNELYVIYLDADKDKSTGPKEAVVEKIFDSPDTLIDASWYSRSNYIVLTSVRDIKVIELRGLEKRNMVTLYKFNRSPQYVYYDTYNDSIYFADSEKEFVSSAGRYIYRLDLRQKFLDSVIQLFLKKDSEVKNGKRQVL